MTVTKTYKFLTRSIKAVGVKLDKLLAAVEKSRNPRLPRKPQLSLSKRKLSKRPLRKKPPQKRALNRQQPTRS